MSTTALQQHRCLPRFVSSCQPNLPGSHLPQLMHHVPQPQQPRVALLLTFLRHSRSQQPDLHLDLHLDLPLGRTRSQGRHRWSIVHLHVPSVRRSTPTSNPLPPLQNFMYKIRSAAHWKRSHRSSLQEAHSPTVVCTRHQHLIKEQSSSKGAAVQPKTGAQRSAVTTFKDFNRRLDALKSKVMGGNEVWQQMNQKC